jgi:ADP-dependent phosphofructokinase/glucokinase
MFTTRASLENCQVFTVSSATNSQLSSIRQQGNDNGKSMNIEMHLHHQNKLTVGIKDTHLVLEYSKGDKVFGIESPRENRFYFSYDPQGSTLSLMEVYHDRLEKSALKPKKHMFGGFQLMESKSSSVIAERLQKMSDKWSSLKKAGNLIHAELAAFQNQDTMVSIDKYALSHTDSLGLNEQELNTLINYFSSGDQQVKDSA